VKALADDVDLLKKQNTKVIIVTSGAVALGLERLGIEGRPSQLEQAQAAAAIGQVQLLEAYKEPFNSNGFEISQLLLTLDDLENRPRYLNARNTLEVLLENGIIPIINENDTVATSELRFGDNDRLAARVAQMASSELLILLSDIDGLYSEDPAFNPDARFIDVIDSITPEIKVMAGSPKISGFGSGGMVTKIEAAGIALAGGCAMVVMNGFKDSPIKRLMAGERATLFKTLSDPLTVRKSWIRGMLSIKGKIYVDDGAEGALKKDASLLPAGVIKIKGPFDRGDLVGIFNSKNTKVGQGLVAYTSEDSQKIMGHNTCKIIDVLGYAGRGAIIHRNDLVLV
jgi:glutamate 5-kinase